MGGHVIHVVRIQLTIFCGTWQPKLLTNYRQSFGLSFDERDIEFLDLKRTPSTSLLIKNASWLFAEHFSPPLKFDSSQNRGSVAKLWLGKTSLSGVRKYRRQLISKAFSFFILLKTLSVVIAHRLWKPRRLLTSTTHSLALPPFRLPVLPVHMHQPPPTSTFLQLLYLQAPYTRVWASMWSRLFIDR